MDVQSRPVLDPVGSLLVSFYAWATAVLFGAVALDAVYARSLRSVLDPAQARMAFSGVSDLLLLVVALTILAAIGAIGSSWNSPGARSLLAVSLFLTIAEPLAPIVLRPLDSNSSTGLLLRLLLSGSASVFALWALERFHSRA